LGTKIVPNYSAFWKRNRFGLQGNSHVEKIGESAQRKVSVKFERTVRSSLGIASATPERCLDLPGAVKIISRSVSGAETAMSGALF
jgi:hypothetical protein